MIDMLKRVWQWIIDRLSERSTKTLVFTILGILAAIGLLSASTVDAIKQLIEAGQDAYVDVSALIGTIVTSVKGVIGIISALIGMASGIFGIFSPDAKGGKAYSEIMRENDLDPDVAYSISIDPTYQKERKEMLKKKGRL